MFVVKELMTDQLINLNHRQISLYHEMIDEKFFVETLEHRCNHCHVYRMINIQDTFRLDAVLQDDNNCINDIP